MQLLLIREPRSLVLTTASHALVFRSPPPQAVTSSHAIIVEFLPKEQVDLEAAVVVNGRVSGCLGVLRIGGGECKCCAAVVRTRPRLLQGRTHALHAIWLNKLPRECKRRKRVGCNTDICAALR